MDRSKGLIDTGHESSLGVTQYKPFQFCFRQQHWLNSHLANLSSMVSDLAIDWCPCKHDCPSEGFNGAFILPALPACGSRPVNRS